MPKILKVIILFSRWIYIPNAENNRIMCFLSGSKQIVVFVVLGNHIFAYTAWKVSKYGFFSGPYFLVFGLNMEIYKVNLRIQSKYRKIQTRKNSVFGHFSRSAMTLLLNQIFKKDWNFEHARLFVVDCVLGILLWHISVYLNYALLCHVLRRPSILLFGNLNPFCT